MSTSDRNDRPRTRIVLAALAFLGIGAAVTTAAWTDQVWFHTEAHAATLNLQGAASLDEGWGEYSTEGEALVIPVDASGFGDIVPNAGPLTTEVFVKNDSSVETTISVATTTSGTLFDAGSTVEVTATAAETTLSPGEHTAIEITLTAGEIPASYQGATGDVLVTVSGSPA